jgi:hypothetical protein
MLIKTPLAERSHDLCETPLEAVEALLRAETLPRNIWEPACGHGAIVRVLRAAGHEVLATDLVDYRSPDQDLAGADFLLETKATPDGAGAAITTPPFNLAGEFVAHEIKLCPLVAMLLRLTFLESDRRTEILDNGYRVHVFKNRLPMNYRAGWDGPKVSNPTTFAWVVWDRTYRGPATINRISWQPTPVDAS